MSDVRSHFMNGWSLYSPLLAFRTIDRLVDVLTEFFQELQHLTGWSFSVLMGGPVPALGGKIDVSSFHVGRTEMGNLFSDAYPNFNSGIMKPWLEFVNRVYCEFE